MLTVVLLTSGCLAGTETPPDSGAANDSTQDGHWTINEPGVAWVYLVFEVPPAGSAAELRLERTLEYESDESASWWDFAARAFSRPAEPGVWYQPRFAGFHSNLAVPQGKDTTGGQTPLFVQAGPLGFDASTGGSELDPLSPFPLSGRANHRTTGATYATEDSSSLREGMGASADERVLGHLVMAHRAHQETATPPRYEVAWAGTNLSIAYGDGDRLFQYRASDFSSPAHVGLTGVYAGAGRELETDLACREELRVIYFAPGRWLGTRATEQQMGEAYVEMPNGTTHQLKGSAVVGWSTERGTWRFHVDASVRADQFGEAQVFGVCLSTLAPTDPIAQAPVA